MITRIQILLKKMFDCRSDKLEFLSEFFGRQVQSTKELSPLEQEELLQFLAPKSNIQKQAQLSQAQENSYFAGFDAQNPQHRMVLSRLYELGWTISHQGRQLVDIQRFGTFLRSNRNPFKKPLRKMSRGETSKLIGILEKMIREKYAQQIMNKA